MLVSPKFASTRFRIRQAHIGLAVLVSALVVGGLSTAGCGNAQSANNPVVVRAVKLAELPGLRSSSHPQLQQAYRELEVGERRLPVAHSGSEGNAYRSWEESYPALVRAGLEREIDALWPAVGATLDPGGIEQARRIIAAQAAARQRFARAVEATPPQAKTTVVDGLSNNGGWLVAAHIGCRMEGLAGFEAVAEGSPADAVPSLARMLRVSQQLAREPDMQARLVAGQLRRDALQLLALIVNHPLATQADVAQVQQTLIAFTSDWPGDEHVWRAEREHGLLVFELVRAGHYVDQLPEAERHELEPQGLLSATQAAALKHVDDDELFYLRAMELQIAAARLPYFQRLTTIEQLQEELRIRSESGDFPLVAGRLLLTDVAANHQRLAEDRCRCEAWLIALAAVLEPTVSSMPSCSLTGQTYELQPSREEVAVINLPLPGEPTIVVRRPGIVQAHRRAAGFDLR